MYIYKPALGSFPVSGSMKEGAIIGIVLRVADMRRVSLLFTTILCCCCVFGQTVSDTVTVYFRQGESRLDPSFSNNHRALDDIADSLDVFLTADSVYQLSSIKIIGGASPESSVALNKKLSERRAKELFDYLSRYSELPDSLKTYIFVGRDWQGLLRLVEQDVNVLRRDEALRVLREIAALSINGERESDGHFAKLKSLGGNTYYYMYRKLFPMLRASSMILTYTRIYNPKKVEETTMKQDTGRVEFPDSEQIIDTCVVPAYTISGPMTKKSYWALRTNMLYDLALVPNIGAEIYAGNGFSMGANWMYAWWSNDSKHYFWRIYGGDIFLRKYFGRLAQEKPLQGHHLGLSAQVLTYDFALGGIGQMAGQPGCSILDELHWGVSIEYGYSMPILRRFNLDFTLGMGYISGDYWEYEPFDGHYVWRSKNKRKYFGPTKLEMSLVWLLGKGNANPKKQKRQ